MPAFVTLGRILFALPFIYLGASKLFDIQSTADLIKIHIRIPEAIAPFTTQLETAMGLTTPQLLAISGGVFEVIAGVMIAVNFGARFFAILLIFYVAATTVYLYNDNEAVVDILRDLGIIGALLMIAGTSPSPRIQGIEEPKFITP